MILKKCSGVYNYQRRSNFKYRLPFFKSSKSQRSLLFCSIKNWNTLPNHLLKIITLDWLIFYIFSRMFLIDNNLEYAKCLFFKLVRYFLFICF